MRDHTGYYRTTALPTPPSDAGTSERETALDWRTLAGALIHTAKDGPDGAVIVGGDEYVALCAAYAEPIQFSRHQPPAAPAAEGPQDDDDGDDSYMVCEVRVNIGEAMEECGESLPCHRHGPKPAALPGAEAGTPDQYVQAARAFDEEERKKLGEWVQANLQHHAGKSWSEGIAAEFAALTSEVRALTEQRDALLDSVGAGFDQRDIEARGLDFTAWEVGFNDAVSAVRARLASPSPTGAP